MTVEEYLYAKRKYAWWLLVLPFSVLTTTWILEDEVPFKLIHTVPLEVKAGEYATFKAAVKRDVARGCSLSLSRKIFTPSGSYIDLKDRDNLSAKQIAELNRRSPGLLLLTIPIPNHLSPGQYELVTDLEYTCNPWNWISPIEGYSSLPFTVVADNPDGTK